MSEELTKIEGKGRSGDIIHQTLEMGGKRGFGKVAAYWLDNGCMSYQQG
jgi:hypothetical protein